MFSFLSFFFGLFPVRFVTLNSGQRTELHHQTMTPQVKWRHTSLLRSKLAVFVGEFCVVTQHENSSCLLRLEDDWWGISKGKTVFLTSKWCVDILCWKLSPRKRWKGTQNRRRFILMCTVSSMFRFFWILSRLQEDPPAGVSGAPSENNIMIWNAVIFG